MWSPGRERPNPERLDRQSRRVGQFYFRRHPSGLSRRHGSAQPRLQQCHPGGAHHRLHACPVLVVSGRQLQRQSGLGSRARHARPVRRSLVRTKSGIPSPRLARAIKLSAIVAQRGSVRARRDHRRLASPGQRTRVGVECLVCRGSAYRPASSAAGGPHPPGRAVHRRSGSSRPGCPTMARRRRVDLDQ
jgi:hypothetical protein